MLQAIALTFVCGILGTVIGGLLGLKLHTKDQHYMMIILAFSAGVMLSMISFDLLPEALEQGNLFTCTFGCAIGVLLLLGFDTHFHHHHHHEESEIQNLHHHEHHIDPTKGLLKLGLMMIVSVALHNFPEGLAIGSGSFYDIHTGLLMASLLMIHNIPEGMGMITPLLMANIKPHKALILIGSSGIPTLLGGIIGYQCGAISPLLLSGILAFAAGCMIYVTFYEILPQVQLMKGNKKPFLYLFAGFLLGFLLIHIMH